MRWKSFENVNVLSLLFSPFACRLNVLLVGSGMAAIATAANYFSIVLTKVSLKVFGEKTEGAKYKAYHVGSPLPNIPYISSEQDCLGSSRFSH